MQQTHAKRKVGGKHNRKFERRSRNRQPHTAASSFRLCGFHRKNHKETIPAHIRSRKRPPQRIRLSPKKNQTTPTPRKPWRCIPVTKITSPMM